MDLRKEYKKETGMTPENTFQECPSAPLYEDGFTDEYCEWLESKVKNLTIPDVSKQRELLIAFMEWLKADTIDITWEDTDYIVDNYFSNS